MSRLQGIYTFSGTINPVQRIRVAGYKWQNGGKPPISKMVNDHDDKLRSKEYKGFFFDFCYKLNVVLPDKPPVCYGCYSPGQTNNVLHYISN